MRTLKLSLVCSISMSLGSTARAAEEDEPANIVGGSKVPAGKWRDVVYVVGRASSCTGTLIAPDVVLTAGHCIADDPYEIRAETVDPAKSVGDRIGVKWSRAYPDWANKYDIGVLMLEHVARGKPRKIAAACTTRERLVDGASVHVVGFGTTTAYGTDDNTALREVDIAVTDANCTMSEACNRPIAPRGEFVAGGGGHDSCFGDSGGPVYLDTPDGPALVGVVSRGASRGLGTPCGNGGVYVRADKVVTWLKNVTGARIDRTEDCGPQGPADGKAAEPPTGCRTGSGPPGLATILVFGIVAAWRRKR